MNAPVLVINSGSSAIKYALIDRGGREMWVIPTDEEGRIAAETHHYLETRA